MLRIKMQKQNALASARAAFCVKFVLESVQIAVQFRNCLFEGVKRARQAHILEKVLYQQYSTFIVTNYFA